MTLAIIYGVLSGFLLSFTYLFFRKSFENINPAIGFFIQAVFGVILWVPFALLFEQNFFGFWKVLPIAIVSAVLSEAFTIYAASKGDFAVTGTILSSYPVYTALFAWLLIDENLTTLQVLFVFLVIVGSIVASLPAKISDLKNELHQIKKPLIILSVTILAAIAIGFADVISKPFVDEYNPFTFLLALAVAQPVVALCYTSLVGETKKILDIPKNIKKYTPAILGGFFSAAALIFFWLSFSETLASIASPLTGTTGVFIALWAYVLDKEKFFFIKIIGILMIVLGVIGIGFS